MVLKRVGPLARPEAGVQTGEAPMLGGFIQAKQSTELIQDVGGEPAPGHNIDGDLEGGTSLDIQLFLNTAHRHRLGGAAAGRKFERVWQAVDMAHICLVFVREGSFHTAPLSYPEIALGGRAPELRAFGHADSAV